MESPRALILALIACDAAPGAAPVWSGGKPSAAACCEQLDSASLLSNKLQLLSFVFNVAACCFEAVIWVNPCFGITGNGRGGCLPLCLPPV